MQVPGRHARALRQHGRGDELIGEKLADAEAQLVADRRPGAADLEVADVVGHEAGARAEDREVGAALLHQLELVGLDGLADLVVADLQVGGTRGRCDGSWMPAICALRQASSAFGAVV
jgi:hypothetical protein